MLVQGSVTDMSSAFSDDLCFASFEDFHIALSGHYKV